MKVVFIDDWSRNLQAALGPVLQALAPYAPSWCREMRVQYRSDLSATAEITVQQEYRNAILRIGGGIFDREGEHRKILCHEFAHLYTIPMQSVAMKLAVHAFPDGPTPGTKLHDEWVRETCEGATEDLALVFLALIER